MTSIARKLNRARVFSTHSQKVGALQGSRLFDSTGHCASLNVARSCKAVLDIYRAFYKDAEMGDDDLLHPDCLAPMSGAKWQEFVASPLGHTMLAVPFKSRMEANIARYFEAIRTGRISTDFEIINWLHEPCRFWYPVSHGVTSYAPDFLLILRGRPLEFVEVKGWLDPRSATAIKRFAKYYPDLSLTLIDSRAYRAIEHKLACVIDGWETTTRGDDDD